MVDIGKKTIIKKILSANRSDHLSCTGKPCPSVIEHPRATIGGFDEKSMDLIPSEFQT